jgi:acetyl-CoA/propionyl-CoA carboxylase biotin carboxyl carrier protein
VEHPVTEMVTGIDLVEWQVRVAAGEKLTLAQEDITFTGHAIEARVYAEDPGRGFLPTGGRVVGLVEPTGPGVRIDSGLCKGVVIGSDYDPMLAKVIAHDVDRNAALRKLDRALMGTSVLGVVTNIDFSRFLLKDPDVVDGRLDTGLLDRRIGDYTAPQLFDDVFIAAGVYLWLKNWPPAAQDPWHVLDGWRVGEPAPTSFRLAAGNQTDHVRIKGIPANAQVRIEDGEWRSLLASLEGDRLTVTIDGLHRDLLVGESDGHIWLAGTTGTYVVRTVQEVSVRAGDIHAGEAEITSPMPGSVIAVLAENGAMVTAGTPLVVVEAMKMEHSLTAPIDGTVELLVATGEQVKVDQLLAQIVPNTEETDKEN